MSESVPPAPLASQNSTLPTLKNVIWKLVIALFWIEVHNVTGLYVFSAIYSIFGAMMQDLFGAALSSLTTDMNKMGTRMGMVSSIISLGALTGSPIAGVLIERDGGGGYLYARMFAASALLAASLTLLGSRTASIGWKLKGKIQRNYQKKHACCLAFSLTIYLGCLYRQTLNANYFTRRILFAVRDRHQYMTGE